MNDNKINDPKKENSNNKTSTTVAVIAGATAIIVAASWLGSSSPNNSVDAVNQPDHGPAKTEQVNLNSISSKPDNPTPTKKPPRNGNDRETASVIKDNSQTNTSQAIPPIPDKPHDCPTIKPNASGGSTVPVGCYDIYVLSQAWGNTYCASVDPKTRKCLRRVKEGQFGYNGVVLHGLWPNNNYGPNGNISWPQYCSTVEFDIKSLPQELQDKLDKVYVGNTALIKHEWHKHGTCTKYSPANFFTLAIKLFDALPAPTALVKNIGKSLSYDEITRIYGGQGRVQLFCNRLKKKAQELNEIRFTFDRNMKLLDINQVLKGECDRNIPINIPTLKA